MLLDQPRVAKERHACGGLVGTRCARRQLEARTHGRAINGGTHIALKGRELRRPDGIEGQRARARFPRDLQYEFELQRSRSARSHRQLAPKATWHRRVLLDPLGDRCSHALHVRHAEVVGRDGSTREDTVHHARTVMRGWRRLEPHCLDCIAEKENGVAHVRCEC